MANEITVSATTTSPMMQASVEYALAAEAMTIGKIVQVDASGTLLKAQANNLPNQNGVLGIVVSGGRALSTGAIAAGEMVGFVTRGPVYLGADAALDETKPVYVSATADGYITQTKPSAYRVVGWPISTTILDVQPNVVGAAS